MDRKAQWEKLCLKDWENETHESLCDARMKMAQQVSDMESALDSAKQLLKYLKSVTTWEPVSVTLSRVMLYQEGIELITKWFGFKNVRLMPDSVLTFVVKEDFPVHNDERLCSLALSELLDIQCSVICLDWRAAVYARGYETRAVDITNSQVLIRLYHGYNTFPREIEDESLEDEEERSFTDSSGQVGQILEQTAGCKELCRWLNELSSLLSFLMDSLSLQMTLHFADPFHGSSLQKVVDEIRKNGFED